ncbi:hypothetical protein CGCS363_v013579 [Colletotrichum siamense]|uniref:uncharacterized protein n=1 Tax=Colletotrichum siamense TaxID=690259 RepID=UPI0018732AC7|nr:uncharacterized protein CGCS363_v013579 [Colletotrichum siamense]KAF5486763.1 hypothetical protein CGCS363_v013579 [Colletotrichum siamense]
MPTTRRLGPPSTFERAWIVDINSVWVSPAHTGAQRPPDFKPRLRYTVAQGEPSAENTLLRDLCQDLPALPGPLTATASRSRCFKPATRISSGPSPSPRPPGIPWSNLVLRSSHPFLLRDCPSNDPSIQAAPRVPRCATSVAWPRMRTGFRVSTETLFLSDGKRWPNAEESSSSLDIRAKHTSACRQQPPVHQLQR